MNERFALVGDREQKIMQALKYAGWYPGRKVDIANIKDYYDKFGIQMSAKVKDFFCEYYGIMGQWYIDVFNLEWGADFVFELFPYPKSYDRRARFYFYCNEIKMFCCNSKMHQDIPVNSVIAEFKKDLDKVANYKGS